MKTLLLLALLFLCSSTQSLSQGDKKVLIIGIDGCRADALELAQTPNIDGLIANGIYSPNALNEDITISGPGWSAILCGVWSPKHLVTGNNFTINDYENYPSIFRHAEEFDSTINTLSICHWDPINDYIVQNYVDFKLNVSTDAEVSDQAASYISTNDPDLTFLHFDDVDYAGHGYGFDPTAPEYINAIETVDALIGPVLQAVQQRPNYPNEDWLILVSSDHGGVSTSHGGTSIEHREVAFIASGNNITQQLILKDSTLISNNPTNCLGDFAELRFDGNDDFVEIPANPLFDFGASQDFTIECRVRTSSSGDVSIVGNKDWFSGNNPGVVFSFKYPAGPEWKVNIGDTNSLRADINVGGEIADNEWHTLSVSFDRDGFMTMYEDGQFVTQADISFIGDINTNEGFFIGTDINSSYDYEGAVAELRIWDTVLDATTISDWYCDTIENTHPNMNSLIGYWKINEGSGAQVLDVSGNNNHGVINGAIWDDTDSIYDYNYDATPRIADVAVTALTHLCVDVPAPFEFDGISWVDTCSTNSLEEMKSGTFNIYPNPLQHTLFINSISEELMTGFNFEIHNISGALIKNGRLTQGNKINISHLERGMYLLKIVNPDNPNQHYYARFIKV